MLSTLLINMNYRLDVLILRQFVDYSEIGLYSVGAALAEYVWLIPDAFKDVLFSRTAKSDSIGEIISVLRINILITVFILAGILLFGRFAIILLYGKEFAGAYTVTCIIFMGVPSMVLYKLTNPLYLANGKQVFYFIALLVSVAVNIGLNFLIIPFMGKEGAALASVCSYTVCGMIFYLRFIRDYAIKWYDPLILRKADIKKLISIIRGKAKKKT